jgi:metallo-beta-lactamase family protein
LKHNLWRPGASIVFVGFQAEGTPGRKIVDGAKKIRIFNEDIAIKAKVWTIGGFSAHAGQSQLLDWLGSFNNKKMPVFLVHGEIGAQNVLASMIRDKLGFDVSIPEYLEEITLKVGTKIEEFRQPQGAKQPIDLSPLLADLKNKIGYISDQIGKIESLPASRQAEVLDLLRQAKLNIDEIKPHIT